MLQHTVRPLHSGERLFMRYLSKIAPRPKKPFVRLDQLDNPAGFKSKSSEGGTPENSKKWRTISTVVALGTFSLLNYFLAPWILRKRLEAGYVALSPTSFTPAKIVSSESITPQTKIIKLKLSNPYNTPESLAPIYSIYVKDSALQIERPYTPLYGIEPDGTIQLWIKKHTGGEVSSWLHSQSHESTIEIRGVVPTWEWVEDKWDHIILISGGTGLTPFYQLLHHVFEKSSTDTKTRFTLLHSSPTPADLPRELISTLKSYANSHPERFNLQLFVDSKCNGDEDNIAIGRINGDTILSAFPREATPGRSWWGHKEITPKIPEKVLFMVCGPQQMIAALAGPRARDLTEGPVGGVLGGMGYGSEHVRKL